MDALGDPTRRAIVERLLRGPLPVGELARDFPISRPAISQHLKILKRANLVVDQPIGNRRLYAVDPAGIDALRAYFEQFWNHALAAFKAGVPNAAAAVGWQQAVEAKSPVAKKDVSDEHR